MLGDAASGGQISGLLQEAGLTDILGPRATKWRRLHAALAELQRRTGNANGVCSFVMRVMEPVRFSEDPARFEQLREELNIRLAFAGLCGHIEQAGLLIARDQTKRRPEPTISLRRGEVTVSVYAKTPY